MLQQTNDEIRHLIRELDKIIDSQFKIAMAKQRKTHPDYSGGMLFDDRASGECWGLYQARILLIERYMVLVKNEEGIQTTNREPISA